MVFISSTCYISFTVRRQVSSLEQGTPDRNRPSVPDEDLGSFKDDQTKTHKIFLDMDG